MRKIILIILCILLCGCDYKELNNLGIVTMITVDYKDNNYLVHSELLNINKDSKNKSIIVKGHGKSISTALQDAENNSEYIFNYSHVYTIILSNEVLLKKRNEINDFFIRNKDLRKDFLVFYSNDIDNILNYKTSVHSSIGESIINITDNLKSSFVVSKYREVLHAKLNNMSYLVGNLEVKDNTFTFNNYYVIKDNLIKTVNKKNTLLYGLLNNKIQSFDVDNDNNSYKIYDYKIKTKVNGNNISLIIKPKVKLTSIDKKDIDTYKGVSKLEKKLNKTIKKRLLETVNYSKNEQIDINNLTYLYYLKYNKRINLDDLKIKVKVDTTINEKGLSSKGFN